MTKRRITRAEARPPRLDPDTPFSPYFNPAHTWRPAYVPPPPTTLERIRSSIRNFWFR